MMRKIVPFIFVLLPVLTVMGQGPLTLEPLRPLRIDLNEENPAAILEVAVQEGDVWSITAEAIAGGLDPVLRLYDPDGEALLANEDEVPLDPDARLENWVVQETGVYTVEVARSGGERATTSGTVEMTLIAGYSDLLAASPDALTIAEGESLELGEIDGPGPISLQFDADFEGRFLVQSGWGWTMEFTPDTLRLAGNNWKRWQPLSLTGGSYGIHLEGQTLTLSLAKAILFTLEVDAFPLIGETAAALTILAAKGDVTLENIALSRLYYNGERIAIPPPAEEDRIYSYIGGPFNALPELRQLGLVGADEGTLTMRFERGMVETGAEGFSVYPLNMSEGVQDFVLGFTSLFRETGEGSACGMSFRQLDEANFASALVAANGTVYIMEYMDGAFTESSRAVTTPFFRQGIQKTNEVLVVGRGQTVTLFVNGWRVITTEVAERSGIMQLHIFLPQPDYTLCLLDNLWVWSLD